MAWTWCWPVSRDWSTFSAASASTRTFSSYNGVSLYSGQAVRHWMDFTHVPGGRGTFQLPRASCSEGGTLVMLPEVGHESDGVLTKSQLSKYQHRTYFDQGSLAIDILDDTNHRNYVVTNLFSWVRSDILSPKIGVFRAILQSLFRALWLVHIGNLRNFLGFTLVKWRQMT